MNDDLGDRMKRYENLEASRRFMPLLPVMARIDGRCFSAFTKNMSRPYDASFSRCMVDTTRALITETNACMGYTQSDEITLAWHASNIKSQIWFDGRITKMVSHLAAQATLIFYRLILERMPEYASRLPTFDARLWNVPNRTEGANVFLWREWDATKNSISMAASAHYSHKTLAGKDGRQKLEMLHKKGINWNEYPSFFKRGTYLQKRHMSIPFTAEELDRLPLHHHARTNPCLLVERSKVVVLNMPVFTQVTNREDVIFDGADPQEVKV